MAKIGLSKPRGAIYNANGSTVTYDTSQLLGKYTAFTLSVESSDDNNLYADNAVAETDPMFNGGTATLTTDDLAPTIMSNIFGLSSEEIDTSTENSVWYLWNDSQSIPYMGIGGVIKRKLNGTISYQAFILPKVQFVNPALALQTQGQTITWQTQDITANIFRSDATDHRWFMMSSLFTTEDEADEVIDTFFNPPEPEPEPEPDPEPGEGG